MTAGFIYKISTLTSTGIRKQIAGSKMVRRISTSGITKSGPLGGIINWLSANAGWIGQKVWEFIQSRIPNFQEIWTAIVQGTIFLLNFNFAASDADLEKQIMALEEQLALRRWNLYGYTLGTAITATVGLGATFAINEAAGIYLLKEAGEEILQDFAGEVSSYFMQWNDVQKQKRFIRTYIKTRRLLKAVALNPASPLAPIAKSIWGEKAIQDWGVRSGNWTISGWIQKQIDKLPEKLGNRVEEFLEGLGEGVTETGYTIASALDRYFFEEATNDIQTGDNQARLIELRPDRDGPERLYLAGNTQQLRATVTQTLATTELLNNRDMGMVVSSGDWDEIPITDSNGLEVMLEFYNFPKPPYWSKDRRSKLVRSRLTIPNCRPQKLDWAYIKTTFKGIAFLKGMYIAKCTLSNGRTLKVYCSSEAEGEKILEALASFSYASIVYPLEITHLTNVNRSNGRMKKRGNEPQYLSRMVVTNWNRLTRFQRFRGQITPTDRKSSQKKFQMHFENKLSTFDSDIAEVTRIAIDGESATANP
ncbi:hypothetical protein ACL6C3_16830 [Capilliphycus salinus ALCB114379]|uniref:hypothetical protein n=1 Tax=Capilliphycus salinus TaxID=2768948 RepID=UPI0039A3FF9E